MATLPIIRNRFVFWSMHDLKNLELSSPNVQLLGGYSYTAPLSVAHMDIIARWAHPQLLLSSFLLKLRDCVSPVPSAQPHLLTILTRFSCSLKLTQMCLVPVLKRLTRECLEVRQHLYTNMTPAFNGKNVLSICRPTFGSIYHPPRIRVSQRYFQCEPHMEWK